MISNFSIPPDVLIKADQLFDLVPGGSTVSNLWDLYMKNYAIPRMDSQTVANNPYYRALVQKKTARCVTLLFPGGNLAVGIHDLINKRYRDKKRMGVSIEKDGMLLRQASSALKDDKELVLAAVKQNGLALQFASRFLQGDPDVVFSAFLQDPKALCWSPHSLRDNKEFMSRVVQKMGKALEYASDRLKNDKEFVLLAVRKSGMALDFASHALKDDKEVVFTAIEQKALAIEYASENLQNSPECIGTMLARILKIPDPFYSTYLELGKQFIKANLVEEVVEQLYQKRYISLYGLDQLELFLSKIFDDRTIYSGVITKMAKKRFIPKSEDLFFKFQ